ncbi:hypothetical protein ACOMHN_062886 [Nucella lapillus]
MLYSKFLFFSVSTATLCGSDNVLPKEWYNCLFTALQMLMSFVYFASILRHSLSQDTRHWLGLGSGSPPRPPPPHLHHHRHHLHLHRRRCHSSPTASTEEADNAGHCHQQQEEGWTSTSSRLNELRSVRSHTC